MRTVVSCRYFARSSDKIHFLRRIYEFTMTRRFTVVVVESPNLAGGTIAMLEVDGFICTRLFQIKIASHRYEKSMMVSRRQSAAACTNRGKEESRYEGSVSHQSAVRGRDHRDRSDLSASDAPGYRTNRRSSSSSGYLWARAPRRPAGRPAVLPLCTAGRQAVLPLCTPDRLRLSSSSGRSWKVVHDLSKWFPLVLDIFLTRHVVVQVPLAERAGEEFSDLC